MKLADYVAVELELAAKAHHPEAQFAHLERAHILSQYSTRDHVKTHWAMLRWAIKYRDAHEAFGQMLRLAGAATKTAVGLVPVGNTGGSNVSPIKPMPLPDDLAEIIARAGR